jgi:CRP-like cAMP-binding protein
VRHPAPPLTSAATGPPKNKTHQSAQGERGDKFYVIEDGVFSCFDDGGREVARVGRGSCFGELALLRRDCRALNVMALADAKARGFGGCGAFIIM